MNYQQLLKLFPLINKMENLKDKKVYNLNYNYILFKYNNKTINKLKSNNIEFDKIEFLYIDRSEKMIFIDYTKHHPLYSK